MVSSSPSQLFHRLFLNGKFSDVSPWLEFGGRIPQKWNAFLVTSFEGTEIHLIKLWCSSWSLIWQSGIFQVFKVTLFSSIHTQLFGSGLLDPYSSLCVCTCACLRREGVKLHSYLHILFVIFQYKKIYLFSLTLDSTIYLFQYRLVHFYFILGCNQPYIYFVVRVIPVLAIGNSFSWFLWLCNVFLYFSFFRHSLSLCHSKYCSFILCFPWPNPRISHFLMNPWFLLLEKSNSTPPPQVHITLYNCQLNTKYWQFL